MDTVRWGIIGCGDVTEVKSGPAFHKADRSELVAVMRRNGELAKDYATRHGVGKWYDNAEALIGDPEVNAIYVATPPAYHKPYTLAAAKAGKPVYVEKPMALNTRECQEMIEACRLQGVPLFVAYYRRALPDFLFIKEKLEQGVIGDLRLVRTVHDVKARIDRDRLPWRVQPALSGGGLFYDVGSHTLDILDFLLGPITDARGHASNRGGEYEAEDTVTATYRFASGVHGSGTWCFSAYGHEEWNEIVGTKGKIRFSTYGNRPVTLLTEEGEETRTFTYPVNIQHHLIQSVVDELTGHGRCPSTGETALRTNRVMEQIVATD